MSKTITLKISMLASLCSFCFLLVGTSSVLIALENEETGLYEVYDTEEDNYIFEDESNWEEAVYLTPDEISFYIANTNESPVQYGRIGFDPKLTFDFSGNVWQNVSDNNLHLLNAYLSIVWVQTLYEWEEGINTQMGQITSHGTGFHIGQYQVLTTKHNVVPFICFAAERYDI